MILRMRPKPLPLKTLEMLISRISKHHNERRKMEMELAWRKKGYAGEQDVDKIVNRSFANQFTILHDVTLEHNGTSFQIDTIILTQYAIFISEIKNLSGTITFDTLFKQLIRSDGTRESGYSYPITQAENNYRNLREWLEGRHFYDIPIYYFVVISDPATVVKVTGDTEQIAKVVVHAAGLPGKVIQLNEQMKGGNLIQHNHIGKLILGECDEFKIDIHREYNFNRKDVLNGVHCPECGWLGMERIYNNWLCGNCGCRSKDTHLKALNDYFTLVRPWITNSECMEFLKINSRHTVSRILNSAGLKYDAGKRRWYKD